MMLPTFAQDALGAQLTGRGGLLFKAQNGGPLHTAIVQSELDSIAKEAGIPRLRFHDLRHTQATVLAHAGVAPQIIQHRLGHSKIGVTMDLYAHEMPGQDGPAVAALERLIGGEISRD